MESAEQLLTISNTDEWWNSMKLWAHSDRFNFEGLVRKAYFPWTRDSPTIEVSPVDRFSRALSKWKKNDSSRKLVTTETMVVRLRRVLWDSCRSTLTSVTGIVDTAETIEPILPHLNQARLNLAEWIPVTVTMRLTNLDLLYSTNHHRRSLEMFYWHVKHAKHTVLLCAGFCRLTVTSKKRRSLS
jgi:hypothetical protein